MLPFVVPLHKARGRNDKIPILQRWRLSLRLNSSSFAQACLTIARVSQFPNSWASSHMEPRGTWTRGICIFNTLSWFQSSWGESFLHKRMQPPYSGLEKLCVTLRFCDLRAAGLPAGCPRAPIIPAGTSLLIPCSAQREPSAWGAISHPSLHSVRGMTVWTRVTKQWPPGLLPERGLKLTGSLGEMWFKRPFKILNSLPTFTNQAISFDVVNILFKRWIVWMLWHLTWKKNYKKSRIITCVPLLPKKKLKSGNSRK